MPRVTVVGACNLDLIFHIERMPMLGESLPASAFEMTAGGKGLNQAVGAARLGARISLVSMLGRDVFGDMLWETLAQEGVIRSKLRRTARHGTGVACPMLTSQGKNAILFVPRANNHLTIDHINAASPLIEKSDILLLQQEIREDVNLAAARIAQKKRVPVMLNAAPARPLPPELFDCIDLLVLNEVEAQQLSGHPADSADAMLDAARSLQAQGPRIVVVTLGPEGALLVHPDNHALIPTHDVEVVDTTGAGDAFCAGFAVALAQGELLLDAVDYGNACGALACTVVGASLSMPTSADVETFLAD